MAAANLPTLNAITSHDRVLAFSIFINISHIHCLCVFCAKLKNISYFNAP